MENGTYQERNRLITNVVDLERFFFDPDPTFQMVSDPDPDPVSDLTGSFLVFLTLIFCELSISEKLSTFFSLSVVLFQIHFRSGAARIRKEFFSDPSSVYKFQIRQDPDPQHC